MMNLKKFTAARQLAPSLLGLSLDGSRLEGVWLKRSGAAVQVQTAFAVTLALDPVTAAPELVGREIRNHLDAAEVRERRCVVALPLRWALVAQSKLPALPEADVAGFLALEAERSFPCDVATLVTGHSICRGAEGELTATLVGMPRNHVSALEALRAAGLRPASFSLGITALQPPGTDTVLALALGESQVQLQITHGGGVFLLRALGGAGEAVGGRSTLNPELVAREVRISLGQLPAAVRTSLRCIRIFGAADLAQELADELRRRFEGAGLGVEIAAPAETAEATPGTVGLMTAAGQMVAQRLSGHAPVFEFLTRRISNWQQWLGRYGTGKLRRAGLIAASVVGLAVLAFAWQQMVLWRLQSRWEAMRTEVTGLEATQARIKQFRPWFDESARYLSILRQLTQAFPQDGVVTAKTVEIREANLVTCTGTARDNGALLETLARLRKAGNVADVKVNRIQGKAPMQFTFDFRWVEGGTSAN
jgi:hypothetical protein